MRGVEREEALSDSLSRLFGWELIERSRGRGGHEGELESLTKKGRQTAPAVDECGIGLEERGVTTVP